MLKPMLAAAAVIAIAGASTVYAQQRFAAPVAPVGYSGGSHCMAQHRRLSADDIKAFADARIAALKAGLALTPDQQKNWPAFEQALRGLAQLHLQRFEAYRSAREQPPTNPFDRLQHRADAMSQRGAALKRVADTGAPLYQSLNEAQKYRFRLLARILRPHRVGFGFWRSDRGGPDQLQGRESGGGDRGDFGKRDDHNGDHAGPEHGDHGPGGMMNQDTNEDSNNL